MRAATPEAPDDVLQAAGDDLQHAIAGQVAAGLVDRLEAVDVQVRERQLAAAGRGVGGHRGQPLLEGAVVHQAGQRVGGRELLQARARVGVGEHQRHQPGELGQAPGRLGLDVGGAMVARDERTPQAALDVDGDRDPAALAALDEAPGHLAVEHGEVGHVGRRAGAGGDRGGVLAQQGEAAGRHRDPGLAHDAPVGRPLVAHDGGRVGVEQIAGGGGDQREHLGRVPVRRDGSRDVAQRAVQRATVADEQRQQRERLAVAAAHLAGDGVDGRSRPPAERRRGADRVGHALEQRAVGSQHPKGVGLQQRGRL